MATQTLTTLKAVKVWLGVTSDTDDDLLTSLIGQVSAFVLSYIQRPSIFKKQFVEPFVGSGGVSKTLRNYPVVAVSSLAIGRCNIAASDGISAGYWFDPDDGMPPGRPQALHLNGARFARDLQAKVIYTAGYFMADEPQTAAASVSVDGPYGAWMIDGGVTYADGRPMIAVASSPAQGQYALGDQGEYQFATADAGVPVLISYSYVPAQLEQACLELVGERYRYRSRIGQSSQSANGMTTSAYSLKDMPDYIKLSLQPFRRLVPV